MSLLPLLAGRHRKSPRLAISRCLTLSLAVLSCLVAIAGCGYHTAGSATHIPANVQTIAVPVFASHVLAYHTEMALTQAVVRELDTRTKLRVLSKDSAADSADAVLSGTVLTQTSIPITYDATSGVTSSYVVTITVKVLLTARDGRVLYRNDALSYREQYQSTQDLTGFIREDPAAVGRLARDFAQALVSDMLESF
jgi:outer membrane lipopolysaccharide assembly protein LptE/RlpB